QRLRRRHGRLLLPGRHGPEGRQGLLLTPARARQKPTASGLAGAVGFFSLVGQRSPGAVDRLLRFDLVDPAGDAGARGDGVGGARGLEDREDFRTADTRLAVQDDLLVL